jgi:uncharacterized membrane protein
MGGASERNDRIAWRSHEVTRIEAFSDAVLAFAVTLLIVSLEVPESFDEMFEGLKSFLPFAACFTLVFQIWMAQNRFFRRYGLGDAMTIALNGMLLFTVLFFMFPLKFLFSSLFTHHYKFSSLDQVVTLFYIYGGGFAIIYVLFAALYWNALRHREYIALTPSEAFETKTSIYRNLAMAGVGLLSMFIASFGYQYAAFAGMIYMLIGPVIAITHRRRGKLHRKLHEAPAVPVAVPESQS